MDDTPSPMTDEEADLFRRLRFGSLPERPAPWEITADVDTRVVQPPDETALRRRDVDG